MVTRRGFTLIEIIVAVVILGVSASFLIPILIVSIEHTKAQTAQNNLLAIAAAQAKFYEDYSSYCSANGISPCYCISTGTNPTGLASFCGATLTELNTNLHLSMSTQDPFQYSCTNAASPYQCVATDGTDTLTFNPNAQPPVSCVGVPNNNYCP